MRRLPLLLVVLSAVACARPYPPPGGERDVLPPRLIDTTPAALAVVAPNNAPVVFRFDERISERNFSEALVTVSPLDGALRVERGRNEVRVSIDGGWRADRVYRVVLLPGVRDLFGNTRDDAAELVFSTGPPVQQTAIYGTVTDRITLRTAQRPVVTALRREDNVTYIAIGDTAGFFALRHLPYGAYELRAFSDQNNNRRRDSLEPVDSGRVVTLQADVDTAAVFFRVLSPDTSALRVMDATVTDSVTIRLRTDDYVENAGALEGATAQVLALPDSTPYATARAITLPLPPRLRVAPQDSAAAAAAPPAPANELVVQLDRPLAPGTYVVRVLGITNINGVAGGGGSARIEVRAPPTVPAVRRDTTRTPTRS